MNIDLELTLMYFIALVVSVIVHEIAHGYVAAALGDNTARQAGRLSLNPVRHVDPFGSLLLPALGAITGLPVIGWAKPVPISTDQLRSPRRDMLLVSFAGPTSNFVLCAGFAALARFLLVVTPANTAQAGAVLDFGFQLVVVFAFVNLLLGVFNLLPIPPLDGSAIFELFMPERWKPRWYKFRPYGLLVIFALVFFIPGFLAAILRPFQDFLLGVISG
jgi:Zn-dependent protease